MQHQQCSCHLGQADDAFRGNWLITNFIHCAALISSLVCHYRSLATSTMKKDEGTGPIFCFKSPAAEWFGNFPGAASDLSLLDFFIHSLTYYFFICAEWFKSTSSWWRLCSRGWNSLIWMHCLEFPDVLWQIKRKFGWVSNSSNNKVTALFSSCTKMHYGFFYFSCKYFCVNFPSVTAAEQQRTVIKDSALICNRAGSANVPIILTGSGNVWAPW